ncbi:phosphoribosyltransferase [Corallococcus interemptor]|uniref:phosphoribosyltransferase n=1 Tax=Corallococcus interemptor TaxID=2316720 RepID=UPI003CFE9534
MYFEDRVDAGRRLARRLIERGYSGEGTLVVGLPRGGIPVAYEVAAALGAPLDLCVVRKVGAPDYPELGLGAVAEGGSVFLNRKLMGELNIQEARLRGPVHEKCSEVDARVAVYRQGVPPRRVEGQRILVVDDGIATGATAMAALQALRARKPGRIILAVPVASALTLDALAPRVDDIVCVFSTSCLGSIGKWYRDFVEVTDADVVELLALARGTFERGRASPAPSQGPG